jgi:hypothetical protein
VDVGIPKHLLYVRGVQNPAVQDVARWSLMSPAVLQRLQSELAALLQPDAILAACGEVGYGARKKSGQKLTDLYMKRISAPFLVDVNYPYGVRSGHKNAIGE